MADGHRLKWLRVRAEYIHEMATKGRPFAEIAQTLSCDPGQAQLIAMTPLDTLHPSVSDSAIAAASELRGRLAMLQEIEEHPGGHVRGLLAAQAKYEGQR